MSERLNGNSGTDRSAFEVARVKTREYAQSLWKLLGRYASVSKPGEERASQPGTSVRTVTQKKGWFLLLSAFPWLLLLLFVTSFFWDFNGIEIISYGVRLQMEGLLKILSISGLIGFLTNWIAITMLFKPASKRPILGHGLIPAQKDRIARRMAQAVSEDLINPELIKRKIHDSRVISRYREEATRYVKGIIDDPGFREELKTWVVEYVDEMIADPEIRTALADRILLQVEDALQNKSIEKVALKAYSFVRGRQMQEIVEESLTRIPASVESGLDKLDELLDRLPDTIDRHSDAIETIVTSLLYRLINQLDVRALVEENLRQYDEQQLSRIIRGATNEQLRYIQYIGAVLGTIGGFVIWEPLLSLVVLGFIAGLLLLSDLLLFKASSH